MLAGSRAGGAQGILAGGPAGALPGAAGHRPSILDVAHNPHAAAHLARNLESMGFFPRTFAVFGMLADKDVDGRHRAHEGSSITGSAALPGPRGSSARISPRVCAPPDRRWTVPGPAMQRCCVAPTPAEGPRWPECRAGEMIESSSLVPSSPWPTCSEPWPPRRQAMLLRPDREFAAQPLGTADSIAAYWPPDDRPAPGTLHWLPLHGAVAMAPEPDPPVDGAIDPSLVQKKRARHRLVGAICLCILAAISFRWCSNPSRVRATTRVAARDSRRRARRRRPPMPASRRLRARLPAARATDPAAAARGHVGSRGRAQAVRRSSRSRPAAAGPAPAMPAPAVGCDAPVGRRRRLGG